jgi:hypothetical protein
VLDGVIRYGDDYVIVLESKLSETSEGLPQASNITFNGQTIQFEGSVIITTWRGVLAYYTNLTDQERLLISEPREIIDDFLVFVERNLLELGPFNTLVSCGEEPPRIRCRLEAIMSGAVVPAAKRFLASTPTLSLPFLSTRTKNS